MRRKFFFILLAIIMLGTITYFYLNQIFLPVKVKAYIENNVSTALGRSVTVESIDFNFLDGFMFTNIYIHKEKDSLTPEFVIPQLSFNVVFADFIKTKTIIVPTIHIDAPVIPIRYSEDKTFNFSDILTQLRTPREDSPYKIIFKNLQIKRAQISIKDKAHNITETISPLNLAVSLDLTKSITFKVSGQLPKNKSSVKAAGEFRLEDRSWNGTVSLENINFDDYFGLLPSQADAMFKNIYVRTASLNIDHNSKQTKAQGHFTTDEMTAMVDNSFYNGKLDVNGIDLLITPERISGRGLIHIENFLYTIDGTPRLKGNILGNFESFYRTSTETSFSSNNLVVSDVVFFTEDFKTIKGNINSSRIKLTHNENGVGIRGDFLLDKIDADLKKTKFTSPETEITNAQLAINEKNYTFKGAINADNVQFAGSAQTFSSETLKSKNCQIVTNPKTQTYEADVTTSNFNLKHNNDITFKGDPQLNIRMVKDDSLEYSGQIVLQNGELTGLESTGPLTKLKGTLDLKNDRVDTGLLSFMAYNTPVTVTGELNNFQNPEMKVTLNTKALDLHSTLDTLRTKIPQLQEIKGYALNGKAETSVNFLGRVNDIRNAAYKITLKPNNADILTPYFEKPFSRLNGNISYNGKLLELDDITVDYDEMPIEMKAKWQFGETPTLSADIDSDDVSLEANIEFHNESIEISKLAGKFHDSNFSAKGSSSKNLNAPDITINGDIKLNTEDLYKVPVIRQALGDTQLSGSTRINAALKGPAKDWKNMTINATLQSDEILLNSLPFIFIDLAYKQDPDNKSRVELSTSLYKGSVIMLSTFDLTDAALPCKFSGKLTDLDLANLRKERKLATRQHLSGALTFYFDGYGPLKRRSEIQGKGYFAITNGYLGQLIPYYKEAHFTDAQANFFLAKGRIITSDGELFSNVINIGLNGWMDFEKNYKFQAAPKINDVIVSKSHNIKVDPSMLLRETISLNCEGALPNKPKCNPHASPKKIINSTTDILREGIGNILDGLL